MPKTHPFAQRILAVSFVFLALAMGLSWTPSPSRAETLPVNRPFFSPSLTPLDAVVQVGAGDSHTCVLTTAGGVKCWGYNYHGQLGDGTTEDRNLPVDVVGLDRGVAAIAVGERYTCALTTAGGVKCWGQNIVGELGDGTTQERHTPVDVVGLAQGVSAITAGNDHACALIKGVARCWGYNRYGQLGDGTQVDSTIPVEVLGLAGQVTGMVAGGYHTCALNEDGGAKCWGRNQDGELGNGSTEDSATPGDVVGLGSSVTAITLGLFHTCALTTEDGAQCWGSNAYGQLGNGAIGSVQSTPAPVTGLDSPVSAISAAFYHTCALTTNGGAKCWGYNGHGQLGDGATENRPTPTHVVGLDSGPAAIIGGYLHTCALTVQGRVKCWGSNNAGQLGNGTWGEKLTPVGVHGLDSGLLTLAAGNSHTCALTAAGGVKCWGDNDYGQLGDNTTTRKNTPVDVPSLDRDVVAISAGSYHTCALTAQGKVTCWGANVRGQLGDGTTSNSGTPVDVTGLEPNVIALAAGDSHTCALTAIGGVHCWGANSYGQLGDGTTESRQIPAPVAGLDSGVTAIAAGGYHTCAVTAAGGVKCWGRNNYGQLGDFTTWDQHEPVDVVRLSATVTAVTAGGFHTCALTTAGGVKCWGNNRFGQIGDGTQAWRLVPVDVVGLTSGVAAITADRGRSEGWSGHTCAATTAGGVKCWGYNQYGQLGDGATGNSTSPVDARDLPNPMVAVSAGNDHTCTLTAAGGAICWGSNYFGQLGDGTAWRTVPGDVLAAPHGQQIFLPALER